MTSPYHILSPSPPRTVKQHNPSTWPQPPIPNRQEYKLQSPSSPRVQSILDDNLIAATCHGSGLRGTVEGAGTQTTCVDAGPQIALFLVMCRVLRMCVILGG